MTRNETIQHMRVEKFFEEYGWLVFVAFVSLLPTVPFLFGMFPAVGDMRDVFIPLETFFHTEELQGHIPAWNPAVSFGFPVIASAQIGFFYPVLLLLRILPIWLELPLAIALHSIALGVGTALFARRLGMSKYAAVFSAISFSLSQYVWQHETHVNIFLALAWFPWQMLVMDTVFRKARITARHMALGVFVLGTPILIGQLQIPLFMMAVSGLYGVWVRVKTMRIRPTMQLLGASTIVIIGVIGYSAIQLLPTAELSALSSRGSGGEFNITQANQFSYPLYHIPTLLFPRFYGNDATYWGKRLEIEYGFYIGVIPLILVAWYGISVYRKGFRNAIQSHALFFGILAIVSFLLALGSLSPLRLIGIEPSFWIFSAPSRWLLFTTFSLSLIAGLGFDALAVHRERFYIFLRNLLFILLGSIVVANLILHTAHISFIEHSAKLSLMFESAQKSSISYMSYYTWLTLGVCVAALFLLRRKKYASGIIMLTSVELAIIAVTSTPLLPWNIVLTSPTTIPQLPASVMQHDARLYSIWKGGDTGAYFTDPVSRPTIQDRITRQNILAPMISAHFGIYGVEWPASLDITEQTQTTSQLREDDGSLNIPLAESIGIGAVTVTQPDNSVMVKNLTPKHRVELDGGSAGIVSEQPSSIGIQTKSDTGGTLIVRDTYYPGWHAYVDGVEVPLTKSPLFFRSVVVPPGEHTVRMQYISKSIRIGGIISLVTVAILLLFAKKR